MRRSGIVAALVLSTFATGMVACDDDDELFDIDDDGTYVAALAAPDPVVNPLGQSTATGVANLEIDDGELTVTITINNPLQTAVTAAHIHGPATSTENAPIVFDFVPRMTSAINAGAVQGQILSFTYDLEEMQPTTTGEIRINPHTLIDMLNNGTAYVNVHTVSNPDGEIRGQVVRQ